MFKKQVKNVNGEEWNVPREELTSKVYGKTLLPRNVSVKKASLTTVYPGGKFSKHSDTYHHVFYYIQGIGVGWLEEQEYKIKPGVLVQVPAGISHGYKNTGERDMKLITFNISP